MHSFRKEVTGVKEKITAIEGHVEYAQSEFQTLHNETIPAIGGQANCIHKNNVILWELPSVIPGL